MARPSPALVQRVARLLGEQRSVPSIARELGAGPEAVRRACRLLGVRIVREPVWTGRWPRFWRSVEVVRG